MTSPKILFKKMEISDIDQIIYWLQLPHVREYWFSIQNATVDEMRQKYLKRLNDDVVDTFIIVLNSLKIGLIQTYFLENDNIFGILESCKGIDLFIGDSDFINKGYGSKIITQFLESHIFADPIVQVACIDPEVANERAIHVYEKVGFTIKNVGYDPTSRLLTAYMTLSREDFKKIKA